jgi:hypothetical protein
MLPDEDNIDLVIEAVFAFVGRRFSYLATNGAGPALSLGGKR